MRKSIEWGKTRIRDNDPRGGAERGPGVLFEQLPDGKAVVLWTDTGRKTNDSKARVPQGRA